LAAVAARKRLIGKRATDLKGAKRAS
jgi:hypothetical protein